MNKLVYKEIKTGKKYYVRRIDYTDAVLIDPETKVETKIKQGYLRENFRYQKKESNPKRWNGDIFKLK